MPRTKQVVLGGQYYEIEQLPMRQNKDFRAKLSEPVDKIVALLTNYKDIEISTGGDILALIGVAKDVLLGSMDMLLDALFLYSPALANDRERIENEAYDDEAITALGEVLKLSYPLDRLLSVWAGQSATQISTNSLTPNGVSGKKHLAGQKNTQKT